MNNKAQRWFIIASMSPVVIFLLCISIAPTIVALADSLTNLSLTSFTQRGKFIGLENYRQVLNDPKFFGALWRTLLVVVIVVPVQFVLGLMIALLLNRDFRGRRIVLPLVMLPTVIAPVVVGLIWLLMLFPGFGIFTRLLNEFNLFREVGVFSDAHTAFAAVLLIDIWEWTPFIMLILLAGLSSMPEPPKEAATLDGASRFQILLHVELPLLKPLIVVALLLRTIDASKLFDTVYVLTGGGPGNSTEVLSTFAFRTNFMNWNLWTGRRDLPDRGVRFAGDRVGAVQAF